MQTLAATLMAGAIAAVPMSRRVRRRKFKFDSVPNALQLPAGLYLGEVGGVATNSKGDIFVYTRTGHPSITIGTARPFAHGGSRLFQFDRTGKFVQEVGKDTYGFMVAAQVRVDPADNIWVVDEFTNMVMKFDPQGNVAMLLGRKSESENVPARAPTQRWRRPADATCSIAQPMWHGMRRAISSWPMARATRASPSSIKRVSSSSRGAKRGTGQGEFANVLSIAVDAQGNVYAADGGNKRVQVFDNNGNFKTAFTNVGNAAGAVRDERAGAGSLRFEFQSAERYRCGGRDLQDELDGTMLGKFGRAGKRLGEFGTVNAIDCRSENTLYVGEIGNLRVQKIVLH